MRTVQAFLMAVGVIALIGVASGQQLPGVAPPNGVPCNAIGSGGAVTLCKPGWSYGCNASGASTQILATDGNRTGFLFQNTSLTQAVVTFGDSSVPGNGFVVQPGNPFLWTNMWQGNIPGRVVTTAISVTGSGSCVFMFTD